MNLTIAGLAIMTSLSSGSTLPIPSDQVKSSSLVTLSKDEIVKIIDSKQHANQVLDNFVVHLPTFELEQNFSVAKVALTPRNSSTLIRTRKELSEDE